MGRISKLIIIIKLYINCFFFKLNSLYFFHYYDYFTNPILIIIILSLNHFHFLFK